MDLFVKTISTVTGFLGAVPQNAHNTVSSIKWSELPGDAQRFFSRVANHSTNFISMRWNDLPQTTKDWIRQNPHQTAFYVANGIVLVAPTPVTAPLLGAAGLATAAPAAGTAAAAIQAALTTVGQGSVQLSHAAAGGHSVAAVTDGLQAVLAIGTGVYGLWTYFNSGAKANAPPAKIEEPAGKSKDKKKKSKDAAAPQTGAAAESKRTFPSLRSFFGFGRKKAAA